MSTTVQTADGFNVTSSNESAESMLAVLDVPEEGQRRARVIQDKGKAVEQDDEPEPDALSKAASEMGKKGAAAAAEKRAADAKAKAAEERKAAKEAKAAPVGEPDELGPEAAAVDGEPDEAAKAAEKKAARHDAQARIAQLAREKRDSDERAERAERRAAELERARPQEQRQTEQRQAQPSPDDEPEPKLEDFTEIGSYTASVAAHATRQALAKHEREQTAQREAAQRQQAIQGHVTGFLERLSGVKADDPAHLDNIKAFMADVDPRLQDLRPSFTIAAHEKTPAHQFADEIITSPHAKEVLSYLTANPTEIQRIAALQTFRGVSRAMAIIERDAQEAATSAISSEREPSRAKPPVKALTGSPHAASADLDPDDKDFDKFLRVENAKAKQHPR